MNLTPRPIATTFLVGILATIASGLATAEASSLTKPGWPASPLRSLDIHGETHSPTCAPSQLEILRNSVMKLAARDRPSDAWFLADALLCRNDRRALKDVGRRAAKNFLVFNEGTGQTPEPPHRAQPGSLLARGQAWSASASSSARGSVRIRFASNEACIRDFSLRLVGRRWLLVNAKEACD